MALRAVRLRARLLVRIREIVRETRSTGMTKSGGHFCSELVSVPGLGLGYREGAVTRSSTFIDHYF